MVNKQKNIIVVTWIGGGNFGTALQSFALCHKLNMLGYRTSLLTEINFAKTFGNHIVSLCKILLRNIGLFDIVKDVVKKTVSSPKKYKFYSFCKKNYKKIDFYFESQYRKTFEQTDVFISGSDQIWNTYFCFNPTMFLDFVKNKRKISYASSIGTNNVKDEYRNQVKELLLKYDKISVRETEAVKVLSTLTGRDDIKQVLDPTLLLEASEWHQICQSSMPHIKLPQEYILVYLIGRNEWYKGQIEQIKEKTGINNVIIIPSEEYFDISIPNAIIYDEADPFEFVYLIENATFVCTDSFHATAFSINLKKNFVEFLRFKDDEKSSQNSRIYDILSHYGLGERIYDARKTEWANHISYDEPSNILQKDRTESLDFLITSID